MGRGGGGGANQKSCQTQLLLNCVKVVLGLSCGCVVVELGL